MNRKLSYIAFEAILMTFLLCLPINVSSQSELIPADASQINGWFQRNVGPIGPRKASLFPDLSAAEENPKIIKVKQDGSGDFKTITDAVKSVPADNKNRVIIYIGPGNYTEKVRVEHNQTFVTLYGDPNDMPVLVYNGTFKEHGTMESGTLIMDGNYSSGVNLKVVNSAPRGSGMAVAMRVGGDYAAFYNCKFYGFQDTLCDHRGKHFFKDCYVEGTVDFVFGGGQSIHLNSEMHVFSGDNMAIIAASARTQVDEPNGYLFAHCKVTGTGGIAYLSRSWFSHGRVVFAYCELSDVVQPTGWFNNNKPETNSTVDFGEYNNKGPGANMDKRVTWAKKLTDADVKKFMSLDYIDGTKWLLPPVKL